jgi:hypothetical protein
MKTSDRGVFFIGLVAGLAMLLSFEALVYYIRWFIPFLLFHRVGNVPPDKIPMLWFINKIASNAIFFIAGMVLLRLFARLRQSGYFGKDSMRILDVVILSCLGLAALGFMQTIGDNIRELHFRQWTSAWAAANLAWRFVTKLLVFREPQTMYLLLAGILWAVREFVEKALAVKQENESII